MILHPCLRCNRRGRCDVETATRGALSAARLPLTTVRFRCALYASDFPVGTVVEADVPNHTDPERDCWNVPQPSTHRIRAAVMGRVGPKGKAPSDAGKLELWVLTVTPDYASEEGGGEIGKDVRQIVRLWPKRVTATGERLEMCETCQRPLSVPVPVLPHEAKDGERGFWCGCSLLGRHVGREEGAEAERADNFRKGGAW